ncbi:MAG: hypothetical protein DRO11_05290, partial [Methanobacteriota archaeon]
MLLAKLVSSHWVLHRWFGEVSRFVSRLEKPRFLVDFLIHLFSTLYHIQAFRDPHCYKSLNHFFTRRPVEKLSPREGCVASPVEGFVVSYGRVENGCLL